MNIKVVKNLVNKLTMVQELSNSANYVEANI